MIIDTSKLVCPPEHDASQREWHLYRRFREEQDRADRIERERDYIRVQAVISLWIVTICSLLQAVVLRTIPREHVNAAVEAILNWMGV